jgi:hypothetical protein
MGEVPAKAPGPTHWIEISVYAPTGGT